MLDPIAILQQAAKETADETAKQVLAAIATKAPLPAISWPRLNTVLSRARWHVQHQSRDRSAFTNIDTGEKGGDSSVDPKTFFPEIYMEDLLSEDTRRCSHHGTRILKAVGEGILDYIAEQDANGWAK